MNHLLSDDMMEQIAPGSAASLAASMRPIARAERPMASFFSRLGWFLCQLLTGGLYVR